MGVVPKSVQQCTKEPHERRGEHPCGHSVWKTSACLSPPCPVFSWWESGGSRFPTVCDLGFMPIYKTVEIQGLVPCVSIYLSICLSAYLSVSLCICLSICLSVYLSIFLCFYLALSPLSVHTLFLYTYTSSSGASCGRPRPAFRFHTPRYPRGALSPKP